MSTSKRTAAIVGPTPETLYWTLVAPCPFRQANRDNAAEGAFQQLRSLRGLAVAQQEGRVLDGVAWHETAGRSLEAWPNDLGFLVAEVERAFGGRANIEQHCPGCPANVARQGKGWGGCFGLLPLWQRPDYPWREEWLAALERAWPEFASSLPERFIRTRPVWYGFWRHAELLPKESAWLAEVLAAAQRDPGRRRLAPPRDLATDWETERGVEELIAALRQAALGQQPLVIGLAVAGFSDGVYWSQPAHCAECHFPGSDATCSCCGSRRTPIPARRRRVLGLRPYLRLTQVLGAERTRQLLEKLTPPTTLDS